MANNENTSSKRLPVVLCLDITYSMSNRNDTDGLTRLDQMNAAVQTFMEEIIRIPKARSVTEIAFILFDNQIRCETDFYPIAEIKDEAFSCATYMKPVTVMGKDNVKLTVNVPQFRQDSKTSTKMAAAIIRSMEKLDARRKALNGMGTNCYAPFFVLVTDGNPDGNDNKILQEDAIKLVNQHCDRRYDPDGIAPFIIGVGNQIGEETLKRYSAGFPQGFFKVPDGSYGLKFREAFELIGNSVTCSVKNNVRHVEPMEDDDNTKSDIIQDLGDYINMMNAIKYGGQS